MASESAGSPPGATAHAHDCTLHESEMPRCTAMDQSTLLPAGNCQAIADCGRRCDRLSEPDPPFHLCATHAGGTDSLPCPLMKLSTEVRMMIWQYLLPEKVSHSYSPECENIGSKTGFASLLKVNKQVSAEASSALYDQVPFEVSISHISVEVCRMHLTTYGKSCNLSNDETFLDINAGSLLPTLKRIRHFEITISLGDSLADELEEPRYVLTSWDPEYPIYEIRNMVKKFINLIKPNDDLDTRNYGTTKILGLDVHCSPGLECCIEQFHDSHDEVLGLVALVAEPFKVLSGHVKNPTLHPFDFVYEAELDEDNEALQLELYTSLEVFEPKYESYASEWRQAMIKPAVSTSPRWVTSLQSKADEANRQLRNIEGFASLLVKKKVTRFYKYYGEEGEPDGPFDNIARVVFDAQIASDEYDLRRLAMILRALSERWAGYKHNVRAGFIYAPDTSIWSMFSDAEELKIFSTYGIPLSSRRKKKKEMVEFHNSWPDLGDESRPEMKKVAEDRERFYFSSSARTWSHLKTPLLVRKSVVYHGIGTALI